MCARERERDRERERSLVFHRLATIVNDERGFMDKQNLLCNNINLGVFKHASSAPQLYIKLKSGRTIMCMHEVCVCACMCE